MPRDQTRYGYPPERPPFEAFPAEIPLDTPISELGWWLGLKCTTCDARGYYPLRLMAANIGWDRTLRQIVPNLKCKSCGSRPAEVWLHQDAGGDHGRFGAKDSRLRLG